MFDWIKKRDWVERSVKTFIESFGGALITAIAAVLATGWPESWHAAWVVVGPAVAAGFATAITAVWNIILEKLHEGK